MTKAITILAALGLCVLLSACLLTPGKFTSTLDIRRDRNFTFTYVGEVIAQTMPSTAGGKDSDDKATPDSQDQSLDDQDETPTPVMMKIAAKSRKGDALPPAPASDDVRMQALADTLAKEYGYRSVKYLGNHRFAVDYQVSGKLDHSFLFPFNIDAEAIIPFVAIELRGRDRVRLKAPGFARTDNSNSMMAGMGSMGGSDAAKQKDAVNALDGTFTLTTDAEIVAQNQETGVETLPDGRKRISWRATPQTKDAPSASLKLDALP